MANLFQAAKDKAQSAEKKANREEVIINDPAFRSTIERVAYLNRQIDELSAESKVLNEEVRHRGIEEFVKLYQTGRKYPGSFNIRATEAGQPDASYMFLPTDRYLSIDKERAQELSEKFGEEVVEEHTTYTMDSKLVEKYGEVLSNLISNCEEIDDADKMKLIGAVSKFTVRKGTISNLRIFEGFSYGEVLEEIRPVYQVKNLKVEE